MCQPHAAALTSGGGSVWGLADHWGAGMRKSILPNMCDILLASRRGFHNLQTRAVCSRDLHSESNRSSFLPLLLPASPSQDVVVQSARPYGQRAVYKFAQYIGAKSLAGRHTPGTFTNQVQKQFEEPRLLILTDPR